MKPTDSYEEHEHSIADETTETGANVRVAEWDTSELRAAIPYFDRLPRKAKHAAIRELEAGNVVSPNFVQKTRNTTTDGLHGWICYALKHGETPSDGITAFGVGNGSGTPQKGDEVVSGELGTVPLTTANVNGTQVEVTGLVDSSEFNNETLTRLGLYGGDELLNHAPITGVSKDNQTTVTVEGILSFAPQ